MNMETRVKTRDTSKPNNRIASLKTLYPRYYNYCGERCAKRLYQHDNRHHSGQPTPKFYDEFRAGGVKLFSYFFRIFHIHDFFFMRHPSLRSFIVS